jgi:hypothetical protein
LRRQVVPLLCLSRFVAVSITVGNRVAVEKLPFFYNRWKFWDRKCPGGRRKSFVELPDAFLFLPISGKRVFQQPQGLSPAISL